MRPIRHFEELIEQARVWFDTLDNRAEVYEALVDEGGWDPETVTMAIVAAEMLDDAPYDPDDDPWDEDLDDISGEIDG